MQLKFLMLAIYVNAALAHPSVKAKHQNGLREYSGESIIIYPIGSYDNVNYYIGLDSVNQEQARVNCQLKGFNFVSIPSKDILDFINDATFVVEDLLWTSGSSHFGNSAFHFDDESEVNNAITINNPSAHLPSYKLVLDKFVQPTTALRVATADNVEYYLCST